MKSGGASSGSCWVVYLTKRMLRESSGAHHVFLNTGRCKRFQRTEGVNVEKSAVRKELCMVDVQTEDQAIYFYVPGEQQTQSG